MYSPKISEELIPDLYRLGKAKKKPMTKIVNEIIKDYLHNIEIIEEEITMHETTPVTRKVYKIIEKQKEK